MPVVFILLLPIIATLATPARAAAPCPLAAPAINTQPTDRLPVGPPLPPPAQPALGKDGCPIPTPAPKPPPAPAATSAKPGKRHLDWLAVPLLSYDSDYGLSYGAAGQFQWSGDTDPYDHQLRFQVLFTTGGKQSHWIQYDSPHFLGTKLRFWVSATYARDTFAPYYGLGNASTDTVTSHSELTNKNPFTYDLIQPSLRVGASYPIGPHLYAFLFTMFMDTEVVAAPGTLLEQQRPFGVTGGREWQSMAGVYRDTRDHEVVPTKGSLLEASVRGSAQALGSSYTYAGVNVRALKFFPLPKRIVLATRIEGDYLTAGAPFYQLSQFGGVDAIDGLGGEWSIRGIPADRYIGRGKLIGTAELRFHFWDPVIRGEPISIGAVAFTDVGRVWQFNAVDDGSGVGLHAGYGAGIRIWRRSFVLRLDVASSQERPFNLYILFGHFF